LIFSTFGSDLDLIELEFNRFCNGTHPMYDGNNGTTLVKFNGTDKTKDYRILRNVNIGNIYRFEHDDVFLVIEDKRQTFQSALELADYYKSKPIKVLRGHHEIYIYQNSLLDNKNSTLYLQEDYK